MKKYIFILFSLALLFSLESCNSCSNKEEKPREEQILEFQNTLTKEDTTTMLKLADDAMDMLKNHKYDELLANLYEYDDSTKEVKKLSKKTEKEYMNMWRMFPVLDYQRIYYSFQLEGCNDVKYKVTWATAEQAGTKDPATTAYMFNPVKVDGSWKLCVKTPKDQVDPTKQ